MTELIPPPRCQVPEQRPVALVDLLDRVLAGGVVIAGEVTLSLAGVDMVRISLRALVASAGALEYGAQRREITS
ncbi:gas vesicle protein [Stackebrandtia soli]|uniref:gas vesicle protein n=1 Tax=Stackebrandtia soli TaxID=1892856 RepID=UPI0039EC7EC9